LNQGQVVAIKRYKSWAIDELGQFECIFRELETGQEGAPWASTPTRRQICGGPLWSSYHAPKLQETPDLDQQQTEDAVQQTEYAEGPEYQGFKIVQPSR
jgi:hypothetical protein